MPSKVSQKRSASPSPKTRQHKRPRINIVNHTSATSNFAEKALNNTEASENSPSLNVPTKKSRKRSGNPSTGARKEKYPRVRLTPSTAITFISGDDASSKTETNTKLKFKLKITMNKNPEPSKMPSKIPEKRSISPPPEEPQTKRTKSTPHKSTTSGFTADVSSKSKETIEVNLAPAANQIVAIRPRVTKSTATDDVSRSEATRKKVHVIQMREKNSEKSVSKCKPKTNTTRRSNQFMAINPREPLRKVEDAEINVVRSWVPLNDPDDDLSKSLSLTNGLVSLDKPLPIPLARDPLKTFGAAEKKFIALWMRANKTVGTRGKYLAFQNLLYSLGCKHPSFDKETLLKFDHRIERFISRIKKSLKECGAIAFREEDKLETYPVFADWTVVWLEEDWNGVYDTRGYYTDNYLEKYSPDLKGYDGDKDFVLELAIDDPFEEMETFIVEVPEDFQIPNVTDADPGIIRNRKHYSNPYGMADWR
ncbi:d5dc0286-4d64-463b-8f03-c05867383383-CDS [Sclerotinia trifoliorum]|uniref:D5dc0286-4d64-463b-8f03-c05867383383-CDS n=1 Tax=Sclerotinia trifoliorum TaxID=28548 RepID=A0A8H2VMJ9_9HELO|nr:d5dc0286-4d64-463b-8f03-c05867383383-CDS [Sclerotinia trifoliorum]